MCVCARAQNPLLCSTALPQVGLTGSHLRAAEPRRDQGVYNPITNNWVVPPTNTRIINGLSFAPATMFSRPTPATATRSLAL